MPLPCLPTGGRAAPSPRVDPVRAQPPGRAAVTPEQRARLLEYIPASVLDALDAYPPGYDGPLDERTPGVFRLPRATPARPLRVRLYFDRLEGPPWLGLLAQCAWLRGGILAPATV